MIGFREMKEKDYIPPKTAFKLWLGGAFSLAKLLLTTNPSDLKKLRKIDPDDERYKRPPRPYDIPKYSQDMKVCKSDEKYLRPTLYCNPQAPEVVALAHKLGAYKVSDREFAENAFNFVKEKMTLEILPFNPVEKSFRRGTGTCYHLITCFIALCRAAGIKARYKIFAMNMIQNWYDAIVEVDPLIKKWYDSMGYFMLEGEGEAFIDGEWTVAHVGPRAERQAAAGIPITRFGEDSIGSWFFEIPGTTMRMESIPFLLGSSSKFLKKLAPGSMERVNISILKQIEKGKKIIEEAGGVEAYNRKMGKKKGPSTPDVKLKDREELEFEG
ncbi:MAG: transglutaminase domain-containing protein [Candidatus Thermoplasmatota archaeon]